MDITKIKGMDFTSPSSGEEYGTIRELQGPVTPDFFVDSSWTPFAEDGCGNYFATSEQGSVIFWDHETDDITVLASSIDEFCKSCALPEEVELDEDQVESLWIDPEFAKQMGIDAPEDGWIKGRPEEGPEGEGHVGNVG